LGKILFEPAASGLRDCCDREHQQARRGNRPDKHPQWIFHLFSGTAQNGTRSPGIAL